jgi:ribosome production factor 1
MKKAAKVTRQKAVKEGKAEKLEPLTIEDKRTLDETVVLEEDEELVGEEKMDEFAAYFDEKTTPQILMTTSERPSGYMFDFLKEMKTVIPNCHYWPRKNYTLQEICEYAPKRGYTDVMVWRENQKEIYQLILIHLPKGPTAVFNVILSLFN